MIDDYYCSCGQVHTDPISGIKYFEFLHENYRKANYHNKCNDFKKKIFAKQYNTIWCKNCKHFKEKQYY